MIAFLHNFFLYAIVTIYFSIFALISSSFADTNIDDTLERKHIRILSIDGGGIRGIIPALILKDIESRLKPGKHLTDCFDIMAGTSTGGIIALLLNTPDTHGKPKYNASNIIELYQKLGNEVFQTSFWHKIKTGTGWWGAKYSTDNLDKLLVDYFHEAELKSTITNVIVPAYEIEQDITFFFKSSRAKNEPSRNYFLKDLARATSAAPSYFNPAQIKNIPQNEDHVFVDGGISTNNPTLAASVYAVELYGRNCHFSVVSLGTGTNYGAKNKLIAREQVEDSGLLGWANKIIPIMMYAVNAVTDYEMRYVLNYNNSHTDYFRLQPIIEEKYAELDKVTPENIQALKKYAQQLIKDNEHVLQNIADILNR